MNHASEIPPPSACCNSLAIMDYVFSVNTTNELSWAVLDDPRTHSMITCKSGTPNPYLLWIDRYSYAVAYGFNYEGQVSNPLPSNVCYLQAAKIQLIAPPSHGADLQSQLQRYRPPNSNLPPTAPTQTNQMYTTNLSTHD
eukprot:1189142-Prorocentrum_minimum.AAC.4